MQKSPIVVGLFLEEEIDQAFSFAKEPCVFLIEQTEEPLSFAKEL